MFILNGEVRSQETTVAIDGDAAGNIRLTGEVFPSNFEYLVTGSLSDSPSVIANSSFSDSLKLLVDGEIFGSPMIDGGAGGDIDSCDASPGVLVVNCDAFWAHDKKTASHIPVTIEI